MRCASVNAVWLSRSTTFPHLKAVSSGRRAPESRNFPWCTRKSISFFSKATCQKRDSAPRFRVLPDLTAKHHVRRSPQSLVPFGFESWDFSDPERAEGERYERAKQHQHFGTTRESAKSTRHVGDGAGHVSDAATRIMAHLAEADGADGRRACTLGQRRICGPSHRMDRAKVCRPVWRISLGKGRLMRRAQRTGVDLRRMQRITSAEGENDMVPQTRHPQLSFRAA